jgi:hypothetical protein
MFDELPLLSNQIGEWDVNDDGFADIVFGQAGYSGVEDVAGQISVYHGSSSGWASWGAPSQQWHRDSSGMLGSADPMDAFGAAIAAGDFDGDGYTDIAIGVPGDEIDGKSDAGSVHIMYGSASGLTASGDQIFSRLSPGMWGPQEGAGFGAALAAGDFNCDGYTDLAIAAPWDDWTPICFAGMCTVENAGSINVLYGSSSGLSTSGNILFGKEDLSVIGNAEEDDLFGLELAAGNFDGVTSNGHSCDDLAVAAPNATVHISGVPVPNAGAVAVLYGDTIGVGGGGIEGWHQGISGMQGTATEDDHFGLHLRVVDDDDDGFSDLAFYVPGDESRGLIYGTSTGLSDTNNVLVPAAVPLSGFPHMPCSTTDNETTECVCSGWGGGLDCEFMELLCDASGLTYDSADGRHVCESIVP